MSVELLQTLSLVAYIMSAVLLVLTIILFFVLRIPQVVGELTGIVRKRGIADISQQNESAESRKRVVTDAVNKERGRRTDRLTDSGRLVRATGKMHSGMNTQKISTDILEEDAKKSMQQSRETTLLPQNAGETTELSQLAPDMKENFTQKLAPETTVLAPELNQQIEEPAAFTVEVELGFCESSELIE